jgi:hypothetical protein
MNLFKIFLIISNIYFHYLNQKFLHSPPNVRYERDVQAIFAQFFHLHSFRRWQIKVFFLVVWPGAGKNARKIPALLPRGPPLKQFYSGPGKVWTLFYFEWLKGRGVTAPKGTIRKFLKLLAVLSLGLGNALMTLALPTSLVRMSL